MIDLASYPGRALWDIATMFLAGSPVLAADSFDRESPVTISRFFWSLFAGSSKLALTEEQIERLRALAATYHLALHRAEQDIGRAQRSFHSLFEDDTVDLTAVEGTLKDIETLRTRMQLNGIKAWHEARGLLTPEQRDTLRWIHADPRLPEAQRLEQQRTLHSSPTKRQSIVNGHSPIAQEGRGGS